MYPITTLRLRACKQGNQFILGIGDVLQVYQTKVFMDPSKYSRDYKDSTYSACSFFHRGRKEYISITVSSKFIFYILYMYDI